MFFLFSLYMEQQLRERERIQEALFDEKERAQVTLDSIGDAVITGPFASVRNLRDGDAVAASEATPGVRR